MAVEVVEVSKTFPGGVRALVDVSLSFPDGKTTAIVGANGSGKSTLGKVIAGVHHPDRGTLMIAGRSTPGFHTPAEAAAAGVRMVYQEAPLVHLLSVAEAMAMFSAYPTGVGGHIRWRRLNASAAAQLEALGIAIDPRRPCASLTSAERAMVSLAIALGAGPASILILDEVTASLSEAEARAYLTQVHELARRGGPVVMVTHRLGELAYADEIAVLREGRVVALHPAGAVDEDQLIAEIVGERAFLSHGREAIAERRGVVRLWADAATRSSRPPGEGRSRGEPVLKAHDLTGDVVNGVDLTVRGGEIVGVAGLRGSGVEELPHLLAGNTRRRRGTVHILDRPLPAHATPADARRLGVSFLPADRLSQGGVASLSVSTNVVLPELRQFWHRPGRERAAADLVIEILDVHPPSRSMSFGTLSGGNQQKVLLGKWLRLDPAVLILDDPTYGVDPGARQILFEAIFEATRAGIGVLMLSTEPEQLVVHCDRVLVMREGRITHELSNLAEDGEHALTLDALTRWAYA